MKRATIVVVEDYPLVRQLYAEALRAAGYDVVERPNARDLVDVVARAHAAAVVLDLGLPATDGSNGADGPNGIEACRRLRSDPRLAAVPVLVLTAHATRAHTLAAAAAGADRFLAKPLQPRELIEHLAAVLASTSGAKTGGPIAR